MESNNNGQKPVRSAKPAANYEGKHSVKSAPAGSSRSAKPAAAANRAAKAISEMETSRKSRQKQQQKKQFIILAAALAALIISIVIIAVACSGGKSNDDTAANDSTQNAGSLINSLVGNDTQTGSDPNVNGSSADNGQSEPTEVYTAQEYLHNLVPGATAQPAQYLEVIKNGPASNKRIAITVDDLNEVDNLNRIMTIAESNGAKLTLFAIGSVVDEKADLQEALRRANTLGFEIENHTYDHDRDHRLYSLTEEEMAYQIYKTQVAVNNALHADYAMHFLRMPGGNGEHDLRTHQYLIQLGNYRAIANWSYSGSDARIKNIRNNLKPGYIYLFHSKSDDLKKLEEFIPYAISQGYELLTLNDLLGYPANEIGDYNAAANAEIPAPLPFVYEADVTLGNKEYTQLYAVQLLQNRLIELGYLSTGAIVDGDYGSTTKLAVRLFQYYNGLTYDGFAGVKTQEILFSSQAKRNTSGYIAGEPQTYPTGEERALFESET